jgi:hypothetical protein
MVQELAKQVSGELTCSHVYVKLQDDQLLIAIVTEFNQNW